LLAVNNNDKKKSSETRLGTLFEAVNNIDNAEKVVLPEGMNTGELQEYVQMMIKDAQPRHLRKENRPSHDVNYYKIPMNYFVVESNTVNYNVTAGSIFLNSSEEDEEEEEEEELIIYRTGDDKRKRVVKPRRAKKNVDATNFKTTVPIYFREHDYGTMMALHIFKHGRKTIDEMVDEIKGIDKHLKTILINKMISDGYLKTYQDEEEDEKTGEKRIIETLELVEKEVEKKKEDDDEDKREKMLPEDKGIVEPANT
jgi:hypothetical protein